MSNDECIHYLAMLHISFRTWLYTLLLNFDIWTCRPYDILEPVLVDILDQYKADRSSEMKGTYLCLFLLQVPNYFGLVQIFWARPKTNKQFVAVPKVLCQTNSMNSVNLVFVQAQKNLKGTKSN